MATGKKSFILYADMIHTVRKLPKDKQGELFMAILGYVNDENPVIDDLLVSVAFEPVKQQLKRDLKDWEATRSKRSEAGKRGGINSGISRRNKAKQSNASQDEANEAVNVNDTVTVTVNERVNKPPTDILKSNLFRQPVVPLFEKVHMAFLNAGGTKEMAQKFFDSMEATGWYYKGSPVTNFVSMVPGYISSWRGNERGKTIHMTHSPGRTLVRDKP